MMITLGNIIALTGGKSCMYINDKCFEDSLYEHGKQEMLDDIINRYGKDSLVTSFSQAAWSMDIALDKNTTKANCESNKTRTVCVRVVWDYYQYFYNVNPDDDTDYEEKTKSMLCTGEITTDIADFSETYIDDDHTW